MSTNDTVRSRDSVYGDAWKDSSKLLVYLLSLGYEYKITNMMKVGHFFAWFMIFNKLIRALSSPYNIDHWVDIAGYATLVAEDIEVRDSGGSDG